MDVSEACRFITEGTNYDFGKFYGGRQQKEPLGVGQIYSDVRIPSIDLTDFVYETRLGYVYVLTHECDVSQDNDRAFNDLAVVCPVIPFKDCIETLAAKMKPDQLRSFIDDLAKDKINRICYIPPVDSSCLEYGGILYLNQLAHSHISMFELEDAAYATSLTAYSLQIVDLNFTNHFLRPKSVNLPLMKY